MFDHLMGSERQNRGFLSVRNLSLSGILHAALLAAVVYASVQAPVMDAKEQEPVRFVEIAKLPEPPKPALPEPSKPEPPKPEAPAPPVATPAVRPPPPRGFQELIPPREPPTVLPEVDVSAPAVDPSDFSGLGQAGGVANGVEGGTPQNVAVPSEPAAPAEGEPGFAYEIAVLDTRPELQNGSQVGRLLQDLYPRMLLRAGIGGQVRLQFVVQPDGRVETSTIQVLTATDPELADASAKVVDRMRFRPGIYKGRPVPVLIQMPVTWAPAPR
jgi:protein TonB